MPLQFWLGWGVEEGVEHGLPVVAPHGRHDTNRDLVVDVGSGEADDAVDGVFAFLDGPGELVVGGVAGSGCDGDAAGGFAAGDVCRKRNCQCHVGKR